MDNMEVKYIVGNRFTKDLSCLESRILDKAEIDTTYCRFILEIQIKYIAAVDYQQLADNTVEKSCVFDTRD